MSYPKSRKAGVVERVVPVIAIAAGLLFLNACKEPPPEEKPSEVVAPAPAPEKGPEKAPEPEKVEPKKPEVTKVEPAGTGEEVPKAPEPKPVPAPVSTEVTDPFAEAQKLLATNPEKAINLLMGLPPGPERDKAMAMAFSRLAKSNPEMAVALLMDMDGEKTDLKPFIPIVAYALSKDRPEDATMLAAKLPPGDQRTRLLQYTGNKWEPDNIAKAEDWARSLPEQDMQEAGLFGVAKMLTFKDLEKAQDWVGSFPDDSLGDAVRGGMAAYLVSSDLEKAQEIVLGLDEGTGKDGGMKAVVGHMMGGDITATKEWIDELPASSSKDRAYQTYILSRIHADPDYRQNFSQDLAENIADESIRNQTEKEIAELFVMHMPPEVARDVVQNTNLSEEDKNLLLKRVGL